MIHALISVKKCIPRNHVDTVFDIDFYTLYHNLGKRLILLDVDNTLISYDQSDPTEKHRAWLNELQTLGYEVVFVSNNRKARIEHFASQLNLPCVTGAKKPFKWGFKRAMRHVKTYYEKHEVLVVGDQLMTDVYGAKRAGYDAILVMPLKRLSEKWYTRLMRRMERAQLLRIKRRFPEVFDELHLEKRL